VQKYHEQISVIFLKPARRRHLLAVPILIGDPTMPSHYNFNSDGLALLADANGLLRKVAASPQLRPAELVSVAKILHVLSMLPKVTPDLQVAISVVGPRRKFDEIETWHYWEIAIEEEELSISSGGHYHHPSTGGDTFTTMSWRAVPGSPATCDDYRENLWMVPDVQSFSDGVADIDLKSGKYRIEVTDWDNALLSGDHDSDDEAVHDAPVGKNSIESQPDRPDLITSAMNVNGGQIPLEDDCTFRLRPEAGDYLLRIRCKDPLCNPPEFAITEFWEFRENDCLLITNREEDYPARVEQMEVGGPNLWKALPGDRLAWVGWRLHSSELDPTLIALINCLFDGYVYGEPAIPTSESALSFGAPTSEATPELRRLWMVGYEAAVSLGLPRKWKPPNRPGN
jgi:hypothetical protein